jgi:glycerophosphoryl diester phosphodiesterase
MFPNLIIELKVTERFDYKDPSKPVYSNRFPINKSAFQLYSLQEEIELIQGMHKSFYSIYDLDKTKTKKKQPGIYVEIKEPEFHKNSGKANFSEIVLNLLKSYNYTKRSDMAIIQCFDPIELERIKKDLKSELILVQLLEDNQVLNEFDW